jgi:trigger factor
VILIIDPRTISRSESDLAAMLNVSAERAAAYTRNVELKVTDVKSLAPAEINQELFDKIYGEGAVTTAEDFRLRIESELSGMFVKDSDKVFKRDLTESIVKKLKLTLPNEFLKKWILSSSKEEITPEQVDAEYEQYSESLKWQLVENKIIKDNDIKVDNEEVVGFTKELLSGQYAQYGMMVPDDEEMNKYAQNVLSNEEEARKIYDSLYDQKVLNFLKDTVKINEKEISYDDFAKLASKA